MAENTKIMPTNFKIDTTREKSDHDQSHHLMLLPKLPFSCAMHLGKTHKNNNHNASD